MRETKREEGREGRHFDNSLGYNLGTSSLIEAILKNQLRQVSLADSGTCSGLKFTTGQLHRERERNF